MKQSGTKTVYLTLDSAWITDYEIDEIVYYVSTTQTSKELHSVQTMPSAWLYNYYYYYYNRFMTPLSRTTRVSRYQKDKPFWILLKQR